MKKTTKTIPERVAVFLRRIKPRKTLNVALLRKVAARLKRLRHEEHYDQGTFCEVTDCGTTGCVAAHTLIAAGLPPAWLAYFYGTIVHTIPHTGNRIGDAAQLLLGLTTTQRQILFDGGGCTWPDPYSTRYANSTKAPEKWDDQSNRPSRIAAEMLEAIANGEVTL